MTLMKNVNGVDIPMSADEEAAIQAEWAANAAPKVPDRVTPYQARKALLAAGLLDQVNAAVTQASSDVQIAWEYAQSIERGSSFIAGLQPALGLSDAQIDALFTAAATF